MVERQLRAMGLAIKAPPPAPAPEDDVRCPTGRPPAARVGWEPFLVAVKRCCDATWPSSATGKIATARKLVDAGTHTMTQSTSPEGWVHLYCRPRKTPGEATSYFSSLEDQAS